MRNCYRIALSSTFSRARKIESSVGDPGDRRAEGAGADGARALSYAVEEAAIVEASAGALMGPVCPWTREDLRGLFRPSA